MNLKEARALCDRATPGPWHFHNSKDRAGIFSWDLKRVVQAAPVGSAEIISEIPECGDPPNIRFILQSRTLVPELVEKLEKYEKFVDTVKLGDFEEMERQLQVCKEALLGISRGKIVNPNDRAKSALQDAFGEEGEG